MDREILDELMGYPHEKPKEVDLGMRVKILCPFCASTLNCFVHCRYGSVVELGVYPCTNPNCKLNKEKKDERH